MKNISIKTVPDIVDLWPTRADFADDMHENLGTIKQWRRRNSIPSTCWNRLVRVAKTRRLDDYVSLEVLAAMHDKHEKMAG